MCSATEADGRKDDRVSGTMASYSFLTEMQKSTKDMVAGRDIVTNVEIN